jgi:hypothetical protein
VLFRSQSYKQCLDNIATVKAAGFDVVGYAIEREETPDNELRDVVGFCRKFSTLVRQNGMKVKFNPRADVAERYGSRIAPLCDIFNIQAHEFQGNDHEFRRYLRNIAQSIKSNNSRATVSVTLSADQQRHASLPNETRLNTLQKAWTYAKDHVDAVGVYYSSDTDLNNVVEPFLSWFEKSGRSLDK